MRPAGLEAPACWHRRSVFPGQCGGGCEIRTREGLPPTRFPTMLARVHRRPPPSANCANTIRVTTGERWRTGVNETQTETSGLRLDAGAGGSFGREGGFEGAFTGVHHRPGRGRTVTDGRGGRP